MYIGSWFYKIINLCPLFWDLTHFKVNICNLMFYFEQISNMPLFTVYLKMLWNCEILKTYDYYLHSAVIKIFSYTYNKYFSTVSFYWSSFKVLLKWRKLWGFPGGAVVESLPANAGDTGSSPGLGRSHMPRSNWAREP